MSPVLPEGTNNCMFNETVFIPFTRNKDLSMDNGLSQLLAETSRALRREWLLTTLLHPSDSATPPSQV